MRALLRVALLLVLMSSISPCHAQPKPVWEQRLGGDCGPAAIAGHRIVLGTINDEERAASLRCYSVTSVELQWEYYSKRLEETYEDNTGFGIRSAPAISGQRVVVYSNRGELLCFDLEGFSDGVDDGLRDSSQDDWAADLIWKVDLRNAYGVFKQDSGDVIGPRIHPLISEGVVYCATGNGSTHGMRRYFSGELFTPAPHAPAIVAVDLESGKVIWQHSAVLSLPFG